MKIAICDDERIIAENFELYIKRFMERSSIPFSIDIYTKPTGLLSSKKEYDLMFLDCQMPEMSGLELAKRMRRVFQKRDSDPAIIFVSSYDNFVFDSFEVRPFRYILKNENQEKNIYKALKAFLETYQKEAFINVPIPRMDTNVMLSDIIYIESDGKYSIIRLTNNKFFKSTKSISVYEDEIASLSENFVRTHRRYIVNLEHISRVSGTVIYFKNGEGAEISRRCMTDFNKKYTEFLKSM